MGIFKCPITGLQIDTQTIKSSDTRNISAYYYPIQVKANQKYIILCQSLYEKLSYPESEIRSEIEKARTILTYEFLSQGFRALGGNTLHWDCQNAKEEPDQLLLKEVIPSLIASNKYPKNRKQKADNVLRFLYEEQKQEGQNIKISDDISLWGYLFMKNFSELIFYVEELERKNLVYFNKEENLVRLTFDGLDTIENIRQLNRNTPEEFFEPQYDIGLSFAGEERSYVEQIADELTKVGVKVFYDNYESFDLWGKDLYQHLNDVYRNKCRYCIIFISKHYANKLWTRHELKAAQAKAFTENEEYILPIRFDETELTGINPQTGYLKFTDFTASQIAEMAFKKLKR